MMNESTIHKLIEMKMGGMADAYKDQSRSKQYEQLDFDERFTLMVDREYARRKSNKLQRLIKQANFEVPSASIEEVQYFEDRRLPKEEILRLAHGVYLENKNNIILMGATGAGKTYLACAFGIAACRNFQTVRYVRLPELLAELAVARAEGTYNKVIAGYKKVNLLILDEWLLYPLKDIEARDLLEIAESRHKKASTIFCSQFDVGGWHAQIGEPTLADAVVDRIVHDSYTIVIEGKESMRKRKGLTEED